MIILNITKFAAFTLGIAGACFFVCGLDSVGEAYNFFFYGFVISILMVLYSIACDIFVVMVLLKRTEHFKALFEFKFYPDNVKSIIQTEYDDDEDDDFYYEDDDDFYYEDDDTYMYHYN
jgi:hypothetical protein